ncbi:hypothetical protein [Nocardia sp. NPDC050412]|uniref:hypothetical protein n=1 Tax=unclassified Nocardia TaxID=2637762 RepID=UPI0037B6D620
MIELNSFQLAASDIEWAGPATSIGAPNLVRFGQSLDDLVEAVGRLVTAGNSPQMYLEGDGLVPFLQRVTEWMDKVGPELKSLLPGLRPLADAVAATAPRIDLSSLISQALHETGDDAVKVRVGIK